MGEGKSKLQKTVRAGTFAFNRPPSSAKYNQTNLVISLPFLTPALLVIAKKLNSAK
jgi:hypothetical protein